MAIDLQNTGFGIGGLARRVAGQNQYGAIDRAGILGAQDLGFFDPKGSPVLREQIRRGAIRTARNRRLKGRTLFGLGGLDPAQARAASLNLEQGIGEDTSNFINDANLAELTGNRDYFRGRFGDALGFERQQQIERMRAKAAKDAQGGGGIGGAIGGIVGMGVGGIAGRGFDALGRRIFG